MAYFDKYGVEFSDDRKTLISCPKEFRGDYIIPNSVTSIGDSAFWGCSGLTSVTIPNSVTSIGEWAFSGCCGLTFVTIPNRITRIERGVFKDCAGLTTLDIPNSVTSIGFSAFLNCTSLISIEIPNSVTHIGKFSFAGCSSLTSVTIPDSVTYIGDGAFEGCSSLTSVTIPNSVTSIGSSAFAGCGCLTAIEIPNSVTSIGRSAFWGCSSLTSVTIPNSVKSIGEGAFSGCSSLPIIDNICYADTYLVKVVNKKIPSYNINENTRFIGSSAFEDCSGLISIEIPNSVISIGEKAFWCCSRLFSITIPTGVTFIGNSAFSYCNCLNSIVVEKDNKKYDSRDNCNAIIEKDTNKLIISCKTTIIPNSVISIGDEVFSAQYHLTSIKIPNSVTHIGKYSFAGCSNLKSVTIPNSVTSIGESAFSGCSGLTSVTIPNSVTNIGSRAFIGCRSLTAVNIPNSVTDIGEYAFADCSSLKTIAIPASVKSIGQGGTFMGCSALESVQWNATNCSIVEIDDDEPGKYEPPFDNLGNIKSFTFGNNVKSIPKYLCGNLRGLTSLTISDRVTSIGEEAFCGCNNLTEIIVPNGQKEHFMKMNALSDYKDIIVEDNQQERIRTSQSIGTKRIRSWEECLKEWDENKLDYRVKSMFGIHLTIDEYNIFKKENRNIEQIHGWCNSGKYIHEMERLCSHLPSSDNPSGVGNNIGLKTPRKGFYRIIDVLDDKERTLVCYYNYHDSDEFVEEEVEISSKPLYNKASIGPKEHLLKVGDILHIKEDVQLVDEKYNGEFYTAYKIVWEYEN